MVFGGLHSCSMRPVDVFVVDVLEQRRRPKGQQRGNVNDWAWWERKKRNGCRVVFYAQKNELKNKKNLDNRQKNSFDPDAFLLLPSGPMAKPEGMLAIMPTNLNNMVFTETKEVIFPAVTKSFQKKQTNPKKTEN